MSDGPVVLAGFATLLLVAWFGCSAVSADCIPCNVKVLFLMGRVCLQWAKELMRQAAGAADGRVVHPCADDSKRTARRYLRSYCSSQGTKHPLGCCGSAKQALPLLYYSGLMDQPGPVSSPMTDGGVSFSDHYLSVYTLQRIV